MSNTVKDTGKGKDMDTDMGKGSKGTRDAAGPYDGKGGSNGKGTARITMTATSTDPTTGTRLENCTGATNFRVKRGPTS